MNFFNSPYIFSQSNKGILISKHITVQVAAKVTGYNIQYLRRMLRSGTLKGTKIGQMWLIDMQAFEKYLQRAENATDKRFGPK